MQTATVNINNKSYRNKRLKHNSYIFAIVAALAAFFELISICGIIRNIITNDFRPSMLIIVADSIITFCSIILFFAMSIVFRRKKFYMFSLLALMFMQLNFFIANLILSYINTPISIFLSLCVMANCFIEFSLGLNFLNIFHSKIVRNMGAALLLNALVELSIVFTQYIGFVNITETLMDARKIISLMDKITYLYFLIMGIFFFLHYSK